MAEPPRPERGRRWRARAGAALLFLLLLPPAQVATTRVLPPAPTPLMLIRLGQGRGYDQRWRPLSSISPALARAVVAAEDARFCEHDGFDWEALGAAAAADTQGARLRGGSTISQQTAKNVFLWPSRDYLRKGLEAGYTVLIEALWGKRRILEVYLNVVEWGPGVYGAEAAARRDFGEGADKLTPAQAARLAAVLPSPLRWSARRPGPGLRRRAGRIGANARVVAQDDLAACAGV